MVKKILISFADHRFANAMERLAGETADFGFDESFFFTENDLPKGFFKGFSPNLYRRGYGYWIWKPYLIKRVLDGMNDGDILVYSDCGNRWCSKSISRFMDYLGLLSEDKPIVAFQQQYLEKDWTKGDVFHYICPVTWKEHAVTLQLWGGCFLMKKTKQTELVINKWLDIVINHRDLVTDRKSQIPNMSTFQENRHDQSVFSLLVKQVPHTEISWKEVDDLDGKWEHFGDYPIQARREHKLSRKSWLLNRVFLRPYHYLQGLYLIVFKHFAFYKKIAWGVIPFVAQFLSLLNNRGGVKGLKPTFALPCIGEGCYEKLD